VVLLLQRSTMARSRLRRQVARSSPHAAGNVPLRASRVG
jgi:hypothetical protein